MEPTKNGLGLSYRALARDIEEYKANYNEGKMMSVAEVANKKNDIGILETQLNALKAILAAFDKLNQARIEIPEFNQLETPPEVGSVEEKILTEVEHDHTA